MSSQADLRAKDVSRSALQTAFEAVYENRSLGEVVVGMPGTHNVLNALAAIAVGLELDVSMQDIRKGLKDLGGLGRRFQIKGERGGVLVLDDYGHHPTEIFATLETARECWPEKRLVVVFQPHRYSRTHALYDRFVLCFNHADVLIVAPLYSAGEPFMEGVDAAWLGRGIKEHGHKEVILGEGQAEVLESLIDLVRPGDVVITLGAGDIHCVGDRLLEKL
jgi:UDP-N-acetylmuramate--alanine ligase